MDNRKIFIITGSREGGKTQFLSELYDFLSLFEKNISGFISRGSFNEDGQKDFILKNLNDGSEVHLATRNEIKGYLPSGNFYFNPEALEIGNKIITDALLEPEKIIMIDEIGPMELAEEIWHNSFMRILNNHKGILIFSTRKRMIERIIEKYKIHEAFIEDIELSSPRKIGNSVLSILSKQHVF
jgi:nucleoside-triphosphatase